MSRRRRDRKYGNPGPRRLSESLGGVADRLGLAKPEVLGPVFGRWESIVGAGIADNCHPVSLRSGTLVVGTRDPGWASQLKFLAPDLITRINAEVGPDVVTEIKVRVEV